MKWMLQKFLARWYGSNGGGHAERVAALYDAVARQSRQPAFYRAYGVPDTLDGRFDLLLLHLVLLTGRMTTHPAAQALVDRLATDMDRTLREMGVGDMGVAKRMRKMGEAFSGRQQAYVQALADGDEALLRALDKNLYGTVPTHEKNLRAMAAYVKQCAAALAAIPLEQVVDGGFVWPQGDEHA